MPLETLTQLHYSTDEKGPWALYVYGPDGYHSGKQWFARSIRYPDEEISIEVAKARAEAAIQQGMEVRICDGGDMLVFHSRGGKQLYPKPEVDFWEMLK